jgi:glucan biosynthesis protein
MNLPAQETGTGFDLAVDGRELVDLRVFLRQGSQTLTETWLYLFEPVPVS